MKDMWKQKSYITEGSEKGLGLILKKGSKKITRKVKDSRDLLLLRGPEEKEEDRQEGEESNLILTPGGGEGHPGGLNSQSEEVLE